MVQDQLKPFEIISSRFRISHESAKYFLGRVQRSFRDERPPHKLIVEFIETQNLEYLLTAYELAALMYESGAWHHALISEPPAIVDDPDLY
jgi:hypothetical protein